MNSLLKVCKTLNTIAFILNSMQAGIAFASGDYWSGIKSAVVAIIAGLLADHLGELIENKNSTDKL